MNLSFAILGGIMRIITFFVGASFSDAAVNPVHYEDELLFDSTPKLKSVRYIIAEALLHNMGIPNSELISRVMIEFPFFSIPEASAAVSSAKFELLRPTVQDPWFHDALSSYSEEIALPPSQEIIDFIHTRLPRGINRVARHDDGAVLGEAIQIWHLYCLGPLREGKEKPCLLKSRINHEGIMEQRWTLSLDAFKEYLADILMGEHLDWLLPIL